MLRLYLQQIQAERLVKLIILVVYRMRWFFTTKPSELGRGRTGGARGLIFALRTWTLRTDNGLLCSLSHQPPPPPPPNSIFVPPSPPQNISDQVHFNCNDSEGITTVFKSCRNYDGTFDGGSRVSQVTNSHVVAM